MSQTKKNKNIPLILLIQCIFCFSVQLTTNSFITRDPPVGCFIDYTHNVSSGDSINLILVQTTADDPSVKCNLTIPSIPPFVMSWNYSNNGQLGNAICMGVDSGIGYCPFFIEPPTQNGVAHLQCTSSTFDNCTDMSVFFQFHTITGFYNGICNCSNTPPPTTTTQTPTPTTTQTPTPTTTQTPTHTPTPAPPIYSDCIPYHQTKSIIFNFACSNSQSCNNHIS
jgi:hypothetical protein